MNFNCKIESFLRNLLRFACTFCFYYECNTNLYETRNKLRDSWANYDSITIILSVVL